MVPEKKNIPFFIVGSPRSGTTLLQTLLDAHPSLAIPPESHVFDHFYELTASYGGLQTPQNLKTFAADLLNDERIKRWGLTVTPEEFCGGLRTPASFRSVTEHLFTLYMRKEGKSRWGDKTPEHTLFLPAVLQTFPEARFIHLVRDGRDVAESLSRMFFGPVTIDKKAELWRCYTNAFYEFKKCLSPDCYLEIHYEALVRDPETEVRKIIHFLGEVPRAAGAAVPDTKLKQVYLSTDDGSHQSLSQPISDKKIGSFKHQLSGRQIEIFESIAGDMLKAYGYALVSSGQKNITFPEHVLFGTLHQFRFLTKLGHWGYVKDRFQYWLRKCGRSTGLFR